MMVMMMMVMMMTMMMMEIHDDDDDYFTRHSRFSRDFRFASSPANGKLQFPNDNWKITILKQQLSNVDKCNKYNISLWGK